MSIPRTIHRIWIAGSPPMPADMVENGARWAELNPAWTVKLWGGPDFRMRNACLYRNAPAHDALRYRSDLLRLEVLLREGGVYVDADIRPLRPLDELVDGHEAVAAYSPDRWNGKAIVSNAFLGAAPGHPWLERCVRKMSISAHAFRGQPIAMMTGPHHVNRCLERTDEVTLIDTASVYPTTEAALEHAFAFHAWENRKALRMGALA